VTTPPAAVAIIRAVIEDTTTLELLLHPRRTAQRIARALEHAGWTIGPTERPTGPHSPTQRP
jgi:hypothetical protein